MPGVLADELDAQIICNYTIDYARRVLAEFSTGALTLLLEGSASAPLRSPLFNPLATKSIPKPP